MSVTEGLLATIGVLVLLRNLLDLLDFGSKIQFIYDVVAKSSDFPPKPCPSRKGPKRGPIAPNAKDEDW